MGRIGRTVAEAERREEARRMRAAGMTFAEVGEAMGYGRSRAQQLAGDVEVRRERVVRLPMKGFSLAMRRWLWAYGWRKCKRCKEWKCEEEAFPPKKHNAHCRECNRKAVRAYYKTEAGAAARRRAQGSEAAKAALNRFRERRKAGIPLMTAEERRRASYEGALRRYRQEAR